MNQDSNFRPRIVTIHGQLMTTSLAIADHFDKNHRNVLRAIRQKIDVYSDPSFTDLHFLPSDQDDVQGKKQPIYHLTETGFSLIAMGFTGETAAKWQRAYAETFLAMRKALTDGVNERLVKMELALADQASKLKAVNHSLTDPRKISASEFLLRLADQTTVSESVVMWYFIRYGAVHRTMCVSIANLRKRLDVGGVKVNYSETRVCAATRRLAARGLITVRPNSTSIGALTYRVNLGAVVHLVDQCKLPWRGAWDAERMTISEFVEKQAASWKFSPLRPALSLQNAATARTLHQRPQFAYGGRNRLELTTNHMSVDTRQ
jgi:Rha family phage regulatory protein